LLAGLSAVVLFLLNIRGSQILGIHQPEHVLPDAIPSAHQAGGCLSFARRHYSIRAPSLARQSQNNLPLTGRIVDRGSKLPVKPGCVNEVIQCKKQVYVRLIVSRPRHLDALCSGGNTQRPLV